MQKKYIIIIIIGMILFLGFLCWLLIPKICIRRAMNGTLLVRCGSERWHVYDWDKDDLRTIPELDTDTILSFIDAGNDRIWIIQKDDLNNYYVELRDGSKVIIKKECTSKPLAVCSYSEGLLLMQAKENDEIKNYIQQGVKLTANNAEILLIDQAGQQTVLSECGYDVFDPCGFFVSQGDKFVFIRPRFYIETDALNRSAWLRCKKDTLCIYENGIIRELSLQKKTIDELRGGKNTIIALKDDDLYAFSLQSGLDHMIAKHVGQQNGVLSPNGRYYVYARLHGIFGDCWDAYVLDLNTGRKIKLRAIHNEGTDGFEFCWVSTEAFTEGGIIEQ